MVTRFTVDRLEGSRSKEWHEFVQKTVILELLREHTLTVQTNWHVLNRIMGTVALTFTQSFV
jgi:hypothetical protein